MARMPGADYRPLKIHGGRMTGHDIACIHTMVGSLWGTDEYFQSGVANSHFGTGGDGHLVQWLDTLIESWANLDGNPDVITLENADMGPEFDPWGGSDVPEFTDPQAETIAHWLAWVCSPAAHADCPTTWTCHREGIPLALIPDDKPGRRGVGYHRHGIDDWRVPQGVLWSSHTGKACPGDRRIAQVPQIIARAVQLTNPVPQEDDDMKLFAFRSDPAVTDQNGTTGTGEVSLCAPGFVWKVPNTSLLGFYQQQGICGDYKNLPQNLYQHVKDVFNSSHVTDEEIKKLLTQLAADAKGAPASS